MKKYLFICLVAIVAVSTLSSFGGKSKETQNATALASYFDVPATPSLTILGYNGKGVTLVSASGNSNTTSYNNWYLTGCSYIQQQLIAQVYKLTADHMV
ncbi:hypothetical protein [Pedobacter sp. NJ-S-72]